MNQELARIVREHRKRLEYSQGGYADFLGVSRVTVQHWESGNRSMRLADAEMVCASAGETIVMGPDDGELAPPGQSFGAAAQAYRIRSGLSVAKLRDEYGLGRNGWALWARDEHSPLITTAERVCHALGFRYTIGLQADGEPCAEPDERAGADQ